MGSVTSNLISGSVQETMIMCFLERAKNIMLFPSMLQDSLAVDILNNNKTFFDGKMYREGEVVAISILLRSMYFDCAIKKYISTRPEATVVCLASGLETNFSRIDNGSIRWYDLDLPDAIDFRRKFIPESTRNIHIRSDVLDYSWMDLVEYNSASGIFFVASGLFCYIAEDRLADLMRTLAQRFPGGEVMFDCYSPPMARSLNKSLKNIGINAKIRFSSFQVEKNIAHWSNIFQIVDQFKYYSRLPSQLQLKWSTQLLMKVYDWLGMMELVQVRLGR